MTTSTPAPRKSVLDRAAQLTPSVSQMRTVAADVVPYAAAIASCIAGIIVCASYGPFSLTGLFSFFLFCALGNALFFILHWLCETYVRPAN